MNVRVSIVVSTLMTGGNERMAANIANWWAGRGWRPTLVTMFQRGFPPEFELHPNVVRRDIHANRDVDGASLRGVAESIALSTESHDLLLGDIVVLARLRRTLRESEPEAIISIGDVTNVRTLAAMGGIDVPIVVAEMNDPRYCSIGPWEPMRRRFYPRAKCVVALTSDAQRSFQGLGWTSRVIPMPVMTPPPMERVESMPRRLVTIARLDPVKRIGMLIQAFAEIADRHPEWRLDIWGEGSERQALEAQIERLGIGDRARICGPTRDVYGVLREASLFAMTSATEGFPNALCEAMACGVAPIVLDCGAGVQEIVREEIDGVLVHGDHKLAGELERLMDDDVLRHRLGEKAKEVTARFGADVVMKEWEKLLQPRKLELIQTLWVGPRLSAMERLSLASFVSNGHEVHLYTYGAVEGVPEGVIVRDGNEILPQSMIFQYKEQQSYSGFSNFFRYKLLLTRGGCWVDTDMVALQPLAFDDEYVFSSEMSKGVQWINAGFIKAPAGSAAMEHAWNICAAKDRTAIRWGETGPALVKECVEKFGLERHVRPFDVFCPIGYQEWERFIDPMPPELPPSTVAVHLWNEMWRRGGRDKDALFDERSIYEQLKRRYGVKTETRAFADTASAS